MLLLYFCVWFTFWQKLFPIVSCNRISCKNSRRFVGHTLNVPLPNYILALLPHSIFVCALSFYCHSECMPLSSNTLKHSTPNPISLIPIMFVCSKHKPCLPSSRSLHKYSFCPFFRGVRT